MAVYKNDTLIEQSIYGSSRLGLMTASSKAGYRTLGGKKYELSNHLGNVLAVVSDNIHLDQDSTWASVINTTDYYPFGLAMDGRSVQDSTYRYGFNGKELDSLGMGGGGSTYDYGFRIYNPAIARFLSVDPLMKSYPWYTPYQFAGNKPISSIDVDGLEPYDVNGNRIDQLEESNLSSIDPKTDNSIWNDLRSHSNEQGRTRGGGRFQSASGERVDIQGIDQAIGGMRNVDYSSLSIDQLPTGFSKEDLFEGFRVYLNHFVGAGTDFKEFSVEDQKLWLSSNPIGAVMQFDGSPIPVENNIIEDWLSDDLTVVVTSHKVANTHSQWVFSTATTLKNGGHAVSGSRQFGISENINGGFTFWTRGTDKAHNLFDATISPIVFKSGEKIWKQLFQNVNTFINENGGRSSVVKPISTRVND
jgi:RHS repeat-associated protein